MYITAIETGIIAYHSVFIFNLSLIATEIAKLILAQFVNDYELIHSGLSIHYIQVFLILYWMVQ